MKPKLLTKEQWSKEMEKAKKVTSKKVPFVERLKQQFAITMKSVTATTNQVASTIPRDDVVLKGVMD